MKDLLVLRVNGETHEAAVPTHFTLLETLRYVLGLTGSKQGCDKGDCGACTVWLDGLPTLACITPVYEALDREVRTVEGLVGFRTAPGVPHPLQDSFDICGAAQCGFCTPGILMSAAALLEENPAPTRTEIRDALGGNLCRCTGYTKILDAVEMAAGRMGGGGEPAVVSPPGSFSEAAATAPSPPGPLSPTSGERGRTAEAQRDRWSIPPALRQRMVEVARGFRKEPTRSEEILWNSLRSRRLNGSRFRRQQPIGPFVVDFYCAAERLVVEVDGGIHESQIGRDHERQRLIQSLGLRFVRVSAKRVERDLPGALTSILESLPHPTSPVVSATEPAHYSPPSPLVGEGGRGGEGADLPAEVAA